MPHVPVLDDRAGRCESAAGKARRVRRPAQAIGALTSGGDRNQAAFAPFEHGGEIVAGAAMKEVDGHPRDLDEAAPRRDQVGQAPQQVQLDQAALDLERGGERRGEGRWLVRQADRGHEAERASRGGRAGVDGAVCRDRPLGRAGPQLDELGADRRDRPRGGAGMPAAASGRGGGLLRGRQEALQVAQPVASITALVDAVEADPPLVAPRPDRVGVDTEKPGRLRDREGRIGGTRGELRDRILSRLAGPPGRAPARPGPGEWRIGEVAEANLHDFTVLANSQKVPGPGEPHDGGLRGRAGRSGAPGPSGPRSGEPPPG